MGRDHKINKMDPRQGHHQHLSVSKEVPTRHHGGEIIEILSRNSTCWGAYLKCLAFTSNTNTQYGH